MRLYVSFIMIFFFTISILQNTCLSQSQTEIKKNIDEKVVSLLRKMTLEDKIGQMTQITLDIINTDRKVDPQKLKKVVIDHAVGSILNTDDYAYSLKEWHTIIKQIQDAALKTRMKIPVLYGIDAIHGVSYTNNSTLFPHNIGLAATRNPELVRQAAKISALEARASGFRWNFDPVLGLGREPLWPRFEETFGEDVYLVTVLGREVIMGYEQDGLDKAAAVASCMKHYLGYSVPKCGKDRTPAYISDVDLLEYFLPPFKAAVEAGAATVMINSASINGIPVHCNKYILTDLLRNELGFEGMIVTDWEDIVYLHTQHKVAASNKEAVKMAVNAGIDMSMVPYNFSFYDDLIELVKEDQVSIERIDDAVTRILKLKFNLGLFDNPYPEKAATPNFGKAEYKKLALNAAHESITLLKNNELENTNDKILPLPSDCRVLIAGPAANVRSALHGSWSYIWQGNVEKRYPETTLTIKQAIENKIGADNVICNSSTEFDDSINSDPVVIKENADQVDYIVLCLGEKSYAETPGNIDDLMLPENQLKLANAAINSGKPAIIILVEGRPRIIRTIEPGIAGIIMAYRPASEGANAIADVLFGDYNPCGKLPFSYPRFTGNIICYDHSFREAKYYNPQWPFGFGLSYTTFKYGDIKLDKASLISGKSLEVTVPVKNDGNLDGKVSVELYTRDLFASIVPPQKRLRKFKKIDLKSGDTVEVKFELNRDDISFISKNLEHVVEEGEFEILIGDKRSIFEYKN